MHSNSSDRNVKIADAARVRGEELLTLGEAARFLTLNREVTASQASIEELIRVGCQGVRLETIVLSGTRHTSLEAVERFCREVAAVDPPRWPDCLLRVLGLN
ncbi:MAG: hypothetical protein IIA64_02730 [Planctomycetes bacterium]|nr:hypothetical protein [Planctomycetota bacterium]